jgi:hypothetical protein
MAVVRSGRLLEFFALSGLTMEKKGLWELPLAADLERTKVLEPWTLRSLGLGLAPQLEFVEVVGADLALAQSFEEVVAQCEWQIRPLNPRHLVPKCDAGELALKALLLRAVGAGGKPLGQLKEPASLGFLALETGFDQVLQYPAGA